MLAAVTGGLLDRPHIYGRFIVHWPVHSATVMKICREGDAEGVYAHS